jgi:hypothetical protein
MKKKRERSEFYKGLKRLFSGDAIVRHIGNKKLKVIDTDGKKFNYALASRRSKYNRLRQGYGLETQASQTGFSQHRLQLFQDYEKMDSDPIITSVLDIYADETTTSNEYGELLIIRSEDNNIKEVLSSLFYDILNIDFNLWAWTRTMCKYGDAFLQLEVHDEYGVINASPLSPYDVQRIEGENPAAPKEYYFTVSGDTKNKLESFQVGHFRMFTDSNFLPYGKSMIEGARKPYKQLTLMEDAMLIHRVMRAPEKRVFKVDIGNIPPDEVDTYMNDVIEKVRKVPYIDPQTGEYNLKFNMQNMLEDFFLPVRGGDSGTEIDTLGGMAFDTIEDIEYIKKRMTAALKVPNAFLNDTSDLEGKATLAAQDLRFARTIERIQRILISELYKIAAIHLYAQGYKNEDLVNFDLELSSPSIVYEQERIEIWDSRANLVSTLKDLQMISEDYIYEKILNMSETEVEEMRSGIVEDQKRKFRYDAIENEGEDPAAGSDNDGAGGEGEDEEYSFESVEEDIDDNDEGGAVKKKKKKESLASQMFDTLKPDKSFKSMHKHRYKGGSPLALESLGRFLNKNKKEIL